MPLYDYRCVRNHITESIQSATRSVMPCSVCQSPANRVAANRVAVTLPEIDMRGKFRRYEEVTAELEHTGAASKPYWQIAKQRAQSMIARGEAPAMHKEQMK